MPDVASAAGKYAADRNFNHAKQKKASLWHAIWWHLPGNCVNSNFAVHDGCLDRDFRGQFAAGRPRGPQTRLVGHSGDKSTDPHTLRRDVHLWDPERNTRRLGVAATLDTTGCSRTHRT